MATSTRPVAARTRPVVSQGLAAEILAQDLANVLKKVKRGGTLTHAERAMLSVARGGGAQIDLPAPPGKVPNIAALASALGVSPQLVHQWKKRPGFPKPGKGGIYLVAAVLEYVRLHGLKHDTGGPPLAITVWRTDIPPRQESEARYEAAKAERAEIKLAKERGDALDADAVFAAWERVVMATKQKILAIPSKAESRWVEGMTARDVRMMLELELREALEELTTSPEYGMQDEDEEEVEDDAEESPGPVPPSAVADGE